MNPDKKYMSQVNLNNEDFKFVPPSFSYNKFRDDVTSNINNMNLDLFPSETGLPKLCYYSNETENFTDKNPYTNINTAREIIPTHFDGLRDLDLDLYEKEDREKIHHNDDVVNKIYSSIEKRNPGIFATLYSYRIPHQIVTVIVKRLIRLTLSYCHRENNC